MGDRLGVDGPVSCAVKRDGETLMHQGISNITGGSASFVTPIS